MATSTQWQLAREAAESYQNILVPAILGPFATALVDFAAPQMSEWIVDVGCGTGAATRYAAEVVGATGRVTGVDVNSSMIDVARSLSDIYGTSIEWQVATATQLPLDDHSVDVVLCAQTLQFLQHQQASISEMQRVIKPDGRVAISLWCDIEENPYFYALVEAISTHIGAEVAAGLQSAFALSNADEIHKLLTEVGLKQIHMSVV